MSESLAGVTLMAFGAGAPDVFASISASEGGDTQGIVMGISVLLGSSLFILAVVTSLVILSSPQDIKLKCSFFLRDAYFLFCVRAHMKKLRDEHIEEQKKHNLTILLAKLQDCR